jgi:hypothetical protein
MDCTIKAGETAFIKPEGLLLPDGRVIQGWSENCLIEQGANIQIFYVENDKKDKKQSKHKQEKEKVMEPAKETKVEQQVSEAAPQVAEKVEVAQPEKVVAQETHAVTAEPAAAPFDVNQLVASTGGNPMVAVVLAGIAVLGGGAAMKFYKQFSEQKHEQAMKKLELDAQSQGLNGAQPPPCAAQNAVVEGRLAAMEAKLVSMEKKTSSFSADFDASDLEERIEKLEKKAKAGGRPPKA